jgi:RimJ/RimL family protein N-acetyltransferase
VRTTERLVLRPFRESDLEPWAALNADPEVTRYLGPPLSREDCDRTAWAINALYEAQGFGFLAIERRSDEAFLGACGLSKEEWYLTAGAWRRAV